MFNRFKISTFAIGFQNNMLSKEKIFELINDKESDHIERTTSTDDTDKFAEAICAFSNDLANHQKPGYLFIGVHDKTCKLSGLKATDKRLANCRD